MNMQINSNNKLFDEYSIIKICEPCPLSFLLYYQFNKVNLVRQLETGSVKFSNSVNSMFTVGLETVLCYFVYYFSCSVMFTKT